MVIVANRVFRVICPNNSRSARFSVEPSVPFDFMNISTTREVHLFRARGESARVPLESSYLERSSPVQRCIWFRLPFSLLSTASASRIVSISRNRSHPLLRRWPESTACYPQRWGFHSPLPSSDSRDD